MKNAVQVSQRKTSAIEFQAASMDIWDKKYRLKAKTGDVIDETMDDTYKRIAHALAEVEAPADRDHWHEEFVWALRRGAIPAGRIVSNAGAQAHKPATSTINCTVSGNIADSMHDILDKVHEAGLTLKAGCGIGYEFSTLRPKGAYVSGAGALTSGPMSFMDIYDRMCFTVSSAGGRRGAQMGTFDVGHPDVLDFIRAKREDGRLRQFNLSLLVTDDFIEAVRKDREWPLSFPVSRKEVEAGDIDLSDTDKILWREWPVDDGYVVDEEGRTACLIYRRIRATRLWDMIMSSTYDYAEPGFVLIDRVNELNNNWFDENIRATNPCVTADTWVQTAAGPRQVGDLVGTGFEAVVDGRIWPSTDAGFFKTATKAVVRVVTAGGFGLRLTADHLLRRVTRFEGEDTVTEWCAAGELNAGDRLLLNDHRAHCEWAGQHEEWGEAPGYLAGLLRAGESWRADRDQSMIGLQRASVAANSSYGPMPEATDAVMAAAAEAAAALGGGAVSPWQRRQDQEEYLLPAPRLNALLDELGLDPDQSVIGPGIESASSEFYRGYLRASFDLRGELIESAEAGPGIRYTDCLESELATMQRMLLRLGIVARRSGQRSSAVSGACLWISGASLNGFHRLIGFTDEFKSAALKRALVHPAVARAGERFVARVKSVEPAGSEPVYDCQIPGINSFDANGLHAHNCGEQPLPPYGSCLLGSVNLTKFVQDPFTDRASFDWEEFRKVVKVFSRMLDNVVEINGLPLEGQRREIFRKRRHGMGFLGLGSTVTMLRMSYGDSESVAFTERVSRELALAGWETALDLAQEKGPAPIMLEEFQVTPEMLRKRPEMAQEGWQVGDKIPGRVLHARYSRYMQRLATVAPELVKELERTGARYTHHSSIAPTGTISLSLANNASNGIEPSFAHHYFRNVIREGRKSKEKVDVFSFELLAYRSLVDAQAMPAGEDSEQTLPDYFVTADDITPTQHVDIQAAAQTWVDSSISKTANVPTDFAYEPFKDIYLYAHEQGLKGCTTFRFNPEAFQGVLVKEKDLKNTTYTFVLEDGTEVQAKGDEEIEYDGELHTAANLFDALKEGYYGKF